MTPESSAIDYAAGCLVSARELSRLSALVAPHDSERAKEQAGLAAHLIRRATDALIGLGAVPPLVQPDGTESGPLSPAAMSRATGSVPFSLSRLAALDSPEARELLARLRELLPLAEAVDMQRGDVLPGHLHAAACARGETVGMVCADGVRQIVSRLSGELEPVNGRE